MGIHTWVKKMHSIVHIFNKMKPMAGHERIRSHFIQYPELDEIPYRKHVAIKSTEVTQVSQDLH
jgi:hypothetical protein